jgi:hypothetical protein
LLPVVEVGKVKCSFVNAFKGFIIYDMRIS